MRKVQCASGVPRPKLPGFFFGATLIILRERRGRNIHHRTKTPTRMLQRLASTQFTVVMPATEVAPATTSVVPTGTTAGSTTQPQARDPRAGRTQASAVFTISTAKPRTSVNSRVPSRQKQRPRPRETIAGGAGDKLCRPPVREVRQSPVYRRWSRKA